MQQQQDGIHGHLSVMIIPGQRMMIHTYWTILEPAFSSVHLPQMNSRKLNWILVLLCQYPLSIRDDVHNFLLVSVLSFITLAHSNLCSTSSNSHVGGHKN